MSKELVTDVNKLSKGDRLETIDGYGSGYFDEYVTNKKGEQVRNFYIFVGVNKGSVTLRKRNGQLISYTTTTIEDGYLNKVYKWTDWRSVPNDANALYKTNRKRIWYKKGEIKVKIDCNVKHGDKFDLITGLELCKKKWEEKSNLNKEKEIKKAKKHNFNINEVYGSVLNAPFYSNVAICINTDLQVRGQIGSFIDEKCDLNLALKNGWEDHCSCYKGINPTDVVFVAVNNVLCLAVAEPHKQATPDRLYQALYEMAWYVLDNRIMNISMPRICCGKGGMKWEDVLEIMNSAFLEAYYSFSKHYAKPEYEVNVTVYKN